MEDIKYITKLLAHATDEQETANFLNSLLAIYTRPANRLIPRFSYDEDIVDALAHQYFRYTLSTRQMILKLAVQLTSLQAENPNFTSFIDRTALLMQTQNTNTLLMKLTLQLLTNIISEISYLGELDEFIRELLPVKKGEIQELVFTLLQQLIIIRQYKFFDQLEIEFEQYDLRLLYGFLSQYMMIYNVEVGNFIKIFEKHYQQEEIGKFGQICILRGYQVNIDKDWLLYQLSIPYKSADETKNLLSLCFCIQFNQEDMQILYNKYYICKNLFLDLIEHIVSDIILKIDYETVFEWIVYCVRSQPSLKICVRNIIQNLKNVDEIIRILEEDDRILADELAALEIY
eukprot:EST47098.1 Hypothetical protein SS50377_12804 [Spironucleus salmonicida]